jgi:hypothetical protein
VVISARNAAAHFQKVMTQIFAALLWRCVLLYLDDLLMYARTEADLLEAIDQVLTLLEEFGIFLQPKKCTLWARALVWCGHWLSAEGLRPNPQFTESLLAMGAPVTAADLQQFLAATNWIRGHIPEYARISAPLSQLLQQSLAGLKKRSKRLAAGVILGATWTEEHAAAFSAVREAIVHAVTIAHPDEDKEFCLLADASWGHWGSMLTQVDAEEFRTLPLEEQHHEPLAFLSGSFRGAQLRWAIPDKEGFSIKESCVKLTYLIVRRLGFHILTDHRNLEYIFNPLGVVSHVAKPTADRLERWAIMLRCFDYSIQHLEGERNIWADMLSRWGAPVGETAAVRTCKRVAIRVGADRVQVDEIMQDYDGEAVAADEQWPTLAEIQRAQERIPAATLADLPVALDARGLLTANEGSAVFVPATPADLRLRILVVAHAGAAGPRGIDVTLTQLRPRFWWPDWQDTVRSFIRECLLCVKTRGGGMIPRPMGAQIQATRPREVLHFDFLALPLTKDKLHYVLVLKDGFANYVKLYASMCATTEVAIASVIDWASIFGVPEVWISDQGSHFRNQVMNALKLRLRANHHFVTPRCAWANGGVERVNREVLRLLKTLLAEMNVPADEWADLLPLVQAVLNTTPSARRLAGRTPHEVMFGTPPTHPLDTVFGTDMEEDAELDSHLDLVRQHCDTVATALEEMVPAVAAGRDQRHAQNAAAGGGEPLEVDIGDYVLVYSAHQRHKLQVKWLGPRRVVDTVNEHVYVLEDLLTGKRSTAHAQRLRMYADATLNITEALRDQIAYDDQNACVEKFLGWRDSPGGMQLRVQWLGFEVAEATWEPLEDLYADVPTLVKRYVRTQRRPRANPLHEALNALE